MKPLPRLSVVIPVRNAAATLAKALASLQAQAYPDLEVLVFDAGSDDGTVEIIRRFESFIAYWRSHPDEGANAAYNEGIARATGEIVALLNADDWYEPGILSEVGRVFAHDPTLDMVTCQAQLWKYRDDGELVAQRLFAQKIPGVTPNATPMPNARFYRRDLFARYGGFQVRNESGQRMIASDLEFLLRLSQHPIRNHLLPRVGYHYLMHPGSITFGGHPGRMRQMYIERMQIAESYLDRGSLPGYGRRLRRWHRRGSARDFYWQAQQKQWKLAWRNAKTGLRISGPFWLLDVLRIGLTGIYRR